MRTENPRRKRLAAALAIFLAALLAGSAAFGLILALRGDESASSLFSRGAAAFEEGRYEDAVDFYERALELEPNSSTAYNMLGMAYRFLYMQTRDTGYRENELEAFREAVRLDPRNHVALVNLGVTLFDQGDRAGALEYLTRALELYPDHPDRAQIEELIREAGLQNGE